jgi:hypothetical protein
MAGSEVLVPGRTMTLMSWGMGRLSMAGMESGEHVRLDMMAGGVFLCEMPRVVRYRE